METSSLQLTPEEKIRFKASEGRASTLQSFHKDFERIHLEKASIHFQRTSKAYFVANEPISSQEDKIESIILFSEIAKREKKRVYFAPVTHLTATKLPSSFKKTYLGKEALFELKDYIAPRFQHSSQLLKRGFEVVYIPSHLLSENDLLQMKKIHSDWLSKKKSHGLLGFLNLSDPFFHLYEKKVFLLKRAEKIYAFLLVSPVPSSNTSAQSAFFSDYFKANDAKPGSIELLFISAMQSLKDEGLETVSLGLSPFLESKNILLKALFYFLKKPISLLGIYNFKNKFRPTRWEPLYLISQTKNNLISDFYELYTKKTLYQSYLHFLKKISATLFTCFILLNLEFFKRTTDFGIVLYKKTGFSLSHLSVEGWFLGPLFHNTPYHFWGDLSTFLIFGAALEFMRGKKSFLLAAAFGLWASNPLTTLIVYPILKLIGNSSILLTFTQEVDYGSSNAIYSFVGALASKLKDPRVLLVPFALNGAFLCFAKTSLLSLHHLIALLGGYLLFKRFSL